LPLIARLFECSHCGTVLDTDGQDRPLLPCDKCGSTSAEPITDIKETVVIKFKQVGATGDPDLRVKIADDYYRKDGEWRQCRMCIDKANNIYEKTVINREADEVLYWNNEPLSSHRGRGSAKQKASNELTMTTGLPDENPKGTP